MKLFSGGADRHAAEAAAGIVDPLGAGEAEPAAVVGRRTKVETVRKAEALASVFGYGNDLSARDLRSSGPWPLGKALSIPLGPCLVTADEPGDVLTGTLEGVFGRADMVWPAPGDVIGKNMTNENMANENLISESMISKNMISVEVEKLGRLTSVAQAGA